MSTTEAVLGSWIESVFSSFFNCPFFFFILYYAVIDILAYPLPPSIAYFPCSLTTGSSTLSTLTTSNGLASSSLTSSSTISSRSSSSIKSGCESASPTGAQGSSYWSRARSNGSYWIRLCLVGFLKADRGRFLSSKWG